MTNVLFVYERTIPTIELLKEKYTKLKQCNVVFSEIKKVNVNLIEKNDVVVLIRPSDPLSLDIARKAKEAGRFVIFYTDDDLIDLPKTTPFSKVRRLYMKKIVRLSQVVLAANPHICEKYSNLMVKPRFACTVTSVDYLNVNCILSKISEEQKDKVKIVYAAGNGHESVFNIFIKPILPKLFKRYKLRISLDFVGVHPELGSFVEGKHIKFIPGMSLEKYRKYMVDQGYDIGLAPLEDTEFNRCKHYNKYLEYTSAGVLGIYSNYEPYTNAIKDKYNGILAENEPESWYEAICYAIDNADARKRYLRNAMDHIGNNYTIEVFEKKIYEDIPELLQYNKKKHSCKSILSGKLKYKLFIVYDKIYLLLYYFKTNRSYIIKKIKSLV